MSDCHLVGLKKEFTPPVTRSYPVEPSDFSAYALKHDPPKKLIQLFELYGEGTFEDKTGNQIGLLFPTQACAAVCRGICSEYRKLVTEHIGLLDDSHTASGLWLEFNEQGQSEVVDCIFWAEGRDAQRFYYIWFSQIVGWVAYIEDESLTHAFCLFKSPAAIILEAFDGVNSPLRSMFPSPSEPFRFTPTGIA